MTGLYIMHGSTLYRRNFPPNLDGFKTKSLFVAQRLHSLLQITPTRSVRTFFLSFIKIKLPKGQFTLWTMKLDHGRWPFSMVQVHGPISMVRLLKKIALKALGLSLGVNRMWTKKINHAPKSECAYIFSIHAQNWQF